MPRGWKVWVEPSAGNWRTRWAGKYGTGQRTFTYKADARDYADAQRRDFQLQDVGKPHAPRAPAQVTIGKFAEEYLAYSKAEKAPRTYRNFDVPAIASLRDFLGDTALLSSVQPSDVQAWKHSLGEGTTASMHFRQARAFFNYAVAMKRIAESPAKGLRKPQESGGGRALTDQELVKLMAHAPEALRRTGEFSLNTILRIEEVTLLRWEWTWVEDGELLGRIPWSLRKTRRHVKKDCVFPINAKARSVMGHRQESGVVFPWKPSTIQHQIIAARRAAKLPEDVTFHCFRHTGATRYLEGDGHMEDLLKSGLWSDPRSLLRYAHVRKETLVRRFKAIKTPTFAPIQLPTDKKPPEPF